jgi:hypothetical protein
MAAIVTLGAVTVASIVTLGVVAVQTDRDLRLAESLTGGAVLLIAVLGGIVVHRWHYDLKRNGHNTDD